MFAAFLAIIALLLVGSSSFTTPTVGPRVPLAVRLSAATKEKVVTVRQPDIVAAVVEKTGLSKKDSEEVFKAVVEVLQENIAAGKTVNLKGFGSFKLKSRAARTGRNPKTGEALQIPASKSPGFTPSKAWKDEINGRR